MLYIIVSQHKLYNNINCTITLIIPNNLRDMLQNLYTRITRHHCHLTTEHGQRHMSYFNFYTFIIT